VFAPGNILAHDAYYIEGTVFKRKYLLVLAIHAHGDMLYRLLTSRQHGRPKSPACYHGHPYPGFYLGVPGGVLKKESWLDLREHEDMDRMEYEKLKNEGILKAVGTIPLSQLLSVIDCCSFAEETTPRQQRVLMAVKQILG